MNHHNEIGRKGLEVKELFIERKTQCFRMLSNDGNGMECGADENDARFTNIHVDVQHSTSISMEMSAA